MTQTYIGCKMAILHVEIVDDECEEDQAYIHEFPESIDWHTVIDAIQCFYPNAISVFFILKDVEQ